MESPINKIDNETRKKVALASNAILPMAGPLLVNTLWKYKYFLLTIPIAFLCICLFVLEAIALQFTASAISYFNNIPKDQRTCISNATQEYNIEFELIAAFGQAIADYDTNHQGTGKGFLELSDDTWQDFGVDGDSNNVISEVDMCDNYFTLANKLASLNGDSETKIDEYNSPQKDQIKQIYELLSGINLIPYGNPISLTEPDLVVITSGYGETRVVNGIVDVHTGVDLVPSQKWYQQNPGASIYSVINKSIITGTVSEFIDSQGALCAYVENPAYKTMYCHCSSFIAKDNDVVKYGDPICLLGATGFVTGPHVHVEIYIKSPTGAWNRVDPTSFLFPQQ